MTETTIDSTLLAAIISAIVAFIILSADRFFIEPRKWRRRYEIRSLEKQIQVHQWLLSILKACREKAKRQAEKRANPLPHLLESADIWKLDDIFEKNAYLLSDTLKQTWYELQRRDNYFELIHVRYRDVWQGLGPSASRHEVISDDLTEMEKQTETDLVALESRYEKLTAFKL